MSNFETFAMITEGNISTAPNMFVASTEDSLATILAAGYMNDLHAKIKLNDLVTINYLDQSVFPLSVGESAVLGSFRVNYDPTTEDWNLIATNATPSGIAALGVHSAKYTNAGGSATTIVVDGQINPNMVILARWSTSANAVSIYTVNPGVGSFTLVSSADPGASILSYIAFVPSVALQEAGVFVSKYSNAGGSATITIADANITTAMVAEVNFISQANVSIVQKVTVGNGTLTILCSANPGVSVIGYVASLPSAALTASGLYSASYSNAGGSATTTISDATITATSVVVANWATSATAVNIQKVTATAGTLTILSSADPGASVLSYTATPNSLGGNSENYLISTNNLSDVANAASAISNIGGLAKAGGQMTGGVLTVKANGTQSGGAVTANGQSGVLTTVSLTTAAAGTTTITFNNTSIVSSSVILLSLMGGSNAIPGVQLSCAYTSAGVGTITVTNNNVAGSALSGTLLIGFAVL